jgi:hypothetical protein
VSEDEYPRLVRDAGSGIESNLADAAQSLWLLTDGTYKVVPADAIVIERSELPEVVDDQFSVRTRSRSRIWASPHTERGDVSGQYRSNALALLALAEYLREHPHGGEREVEALARMLHTEGDDGRWETAGPSSRDFYLDHARRLLATGRVHVDTEGADRG